MVDIVTEATSLNMQMVEDLAYVKSQIETNMATKSDIAALPGATNVCAAIPQPSRRAETKAVQR